MALKMFEKFDPRANPADGNYPEGSIKNESIPGANDGTPLDAEWGNDYVGFTDALLAEAGITPSGNADTVNTSDRLESLKIVANKSANLTRALSAILNDDKLRLGMVHTISDRANEKFDTVLTSGVTPNTFNIIIGVNNPLLSVVLRDKSNPIAWGAVEGGVVDCADAVEAWDNHRKSVIETSPYSVKWPAGKYLFSRGIDFSTIGKERSQITGGDGFEVVEIICDFNGYGTGATDTFMLNLGLDTIPGYHSALSISGFHFSRGPNCDRAPVAVMGGFISQSRISGMTHGSWNNNILRLVSPQNNRITNYSTFSGGESFEYKDATGVLVQQAGSTLTSNGAIFSASDVGHVVGIWGISGSTQRRKSTIISYTSPTVVELDTDHTDTVDRGIWFGCPLVSITNGSTTLTADAPCFTVDHVGLVFWVKKGRADGRFLRERVTTFISSTQVTLENAAQSTVIKEEFTVPAVDISSTDLAVGSDNSYEMQIENHRGVGICIQRQNIVNFTATKIHGEQSATPSIYSISPMWSEQASGYFQGTFDAQYLGEEKIFGCYQTSVLSFENLTVRSAFYERLMRVGIRAVAFEGGLIQLDDVTISSAAVGESNIENLIFDENADIPGYVLTGKVSFNELDATVSYNGRNPGESSKDFTSEVAWNGTSPTGGSEKYRWSRVGNIVFYEFRLDYAVQGSVNTRVTIEIPTDMPTPDTFSENADGEIIKDVVGMMSIDNTGASNPPLVKQILRRNGSGGYQWRMDMNSGSISVLFATMSGFYFTEI